jgi:hypothetical protein
MPGGFYWRDALVSELSPVVHRFALQIAANRWRPGACACLHKGAYVSGLHTCPRRSHVKQDEPNRMNGAGRWLVIARANPAMHEPRSVLPILLGAAVRAGHRGGDGGREDQSALAAVGGQILGASGGPSTLDRRVERATAATGHVIDSLRRPRGRSGRWLGRDLDVPAAAPWGAVVAAMPFGEGMSKAWSHRVCLDVCLAYKTPSVTKGFGPKR